MKRIVSLFFLLVGLMFQQSAQARLTISVEGVSGAGKTTLLKILQKEISHLTLVPEPIEEWKAGKFDIFAEYMANKKLAYTFHNRVFASHVRAYFNAWINAPFNNVIIMDRFLACVFAFVPLAYKNGFISQIEYETFYKDIRVTMHLLRASTNQNVHPDGVIYLRTSPPECYRRALNRNRDIMDVAKTAPASDALPFYQGLFEAHEKWLVTREVYDESIMPRDIPVLVIDGDKDFLNDEKEQQKVVRQVKEFMQDRTKQKSIYHFGRNGRSRYACL